VFLSSSRLSIETVMSFLCKIYNSMEKESSLNLFTDHNKNRVKG